MRTASSHLTHTDMMAPAAAFTVPPVSHQSDPTEAFNSANVPGGIFSGR
jgi:hypothetical protein